MAEQQVCLIDRREVERRVGLSGATIYRRVKAGTFPRPLDLGVTVRWRDVDIEEWIASLPTLGSGRSAD